MEDDGEPHFSIRRRTAKTGQRSMDDSEKSHNLFAFEANAGSGERRLRAQPWAGRSWHQWATELGGVNPKKPRTPWRGRQGGICMAR